MDGRGLAVRKSDTMKGIYRVQKKAKWGKTCGGERRNREKLGKKITKE
jgi:hypothetical protein